MKTLATIALAGLLTSANAAEMATVAKDSQTSSTLALKKPKKHGFVWTNETLRGSETSLMEANKKDLANLMKLLRESTPEYKDTASYAIAYIQTKAMLDKDTRSPFWNAEWTKEIGTAPQPGKASMDAYRAYLAEMEKARQAEQDRLAKLEKDKRDEERQEALLYATEAGNQLQAQRNQMQAQQNIIQMDQARSLRAIQNSTEDQTESIRRIEQTITSRR